ncbi:hypothetical protein [Candidatus Nitrososphaera sp. FF02]|uniref:hypothetical protein n=1 Tax=Candidatus Nitrososphaera sp. FF02 TaxID=3398226 RepID=UPI0039E9B1A4
MSYTSISIKKFLIATVAFLLAAQFIVSMLPAAFAHGGMQPPAADFGGKKASLFVKVDPPVITDVTQPILISARFFDENTNENFKEVTYRIFFEKDGKEIPIQTEGGGTYGGQGLFYDPQGDLEIKIIPKDSSTATAKGIEEIQYGGIWNMGAPITVEGPIFSEPGLYNLYVEIHTVGTTRTQVEPILRYDIWVAPGREEMINVADGQQVKIRNYYGTINDSSYDSEGKTIEFSMPFNWTSNFVNRIGMLHTEVFIPKSMSDFDRESLDATVNGIDIPVVVDTYSPDDIIVHFTISKENLANVADKVLSENGTQNKVVFALSPPETEVKAVQVSANSENYKVTLAWPEQILSEQPVTFGIRLTDNSGTPLSSATYEFVIIDKDGNEVTRSGGVTTPEGISSQDVIFASQGSFTVKVEKINASNESIQSSISVVPEFSTGMAAIIAALCISTIIAIRRTF